MNSGRLLWLGAILLAAGIALLTVAAVSSGNGSAGGFILIGPFPIVFGSGSNGDVLALLSVVLGGLMIVLLFVMSRRLASLTHEGRPETDK
jgi:uncharacterized membrane protein